MRKLIWPAVAAALALAMATGLAIAANGRTNDLPYSAVQADPGVPNLIADMNASKLESTVHDGDLKAGNGPTANPPSVTCSDALYQTALGWFNSLEGGAMFTPGDNDWTDCDRRRMGASTRSAASSSSGNFSSARLHREPSLERQGRDVRHRAPATTSATPRRIRTRTPLATLRTSSG